MRSEQLTIDQLSRLSRSLRPVADYLDRLESRMKENDFPTDDRIYQRAAWANKLVGDLADRVDSELRRWESIFGTATRTTGGMFRAK